MKQCYCLTVDLQAVKIAPSLNASALYYKTKLCVHNYTIYNMTNHVKCYWWCETEGELVASSFTTCLLDYLSENCLNPPLPIVIWSDGCTYQNRNTVLSNALLNFSIAHNIQIEQKILERGHTQMECDSVHACIEKRLRNRKIQLPSDYKTVTEEARAKPFPYESSYLRHTFFKNYAIKENLSYKSIRPGSKVNDPTVTDLRSIKYTPNGEIEYKLNFGSDYAPLPQRHTKFTVVPGNYPQLYQTQIKISAQKYNHLQQLKSVLNEDCHAFYDNLVHE